MLENFSHFQNTLNAHDGVKLNSCLPTKYSTKQLKEGGYNINNRKRAYSLSNQAKENLLNETNVNFGGRPSLPIYKKEIVEGFIVDNTTESRIVKKNCVFFLKYL
jgi:hypothetical protein